MALADEMAQRWAIALILGRPLDGIGSLPLEDIAREGPHLCAQMLRALQSEVEFDRLTGSGPPTGRESSAPALRIGLIAGAEDAVGVIEAVEALRGVLWEALLEELHWPASERSATRRLADLSDRLAHVCARALVVAVAAQGAAGGKTGSEMVVVAAAEISPRERTGEARSRSEVTIVDEGVDGPLARHRSASAPVSQAAVVPPAAERAPFRAETIPAQAAEVPERPLSWDESPPVPPAARGAEIEIRDERREEGPAAWIRSIGSQLERYAEDGIPFSVLLVEPVEIERLRRTPDELQELAGSLEEALSRFANGTLTAQRPGRYWLLVPATNRSEAHELAERLQQEVGAGILHRGAQLQLAVGTASCPEDGLETSALAAHADVGLYAHRSAARSAAIRTPIAGPSSPGGLSAG